jgi:D-lactate dehydrogenase (cytochrome)
MLIKTEYDSLQNYLSDASNIKGNADKVFIPENIDEINDILKNCNDETTPLTISAGGTGTTGGRVPINGAILSIEKLNKILEIDSENQTATIEPGLILKDFQEVLLEKGFIYPPNPTETSSMVGGNIATNASGARTFKYGSTRDFVLELDIVLPNGDDLQLKRGEKSTKSTAFHFKTNNNLIDIPFKTVNIPETSKNAAGFFIREGMDLIDLFIGSEGTLGVVKKIKLKLIKMPENEIGLVIFFKDENRLIDFVYEARNLSRDKSDILSARLIEYFDNESLKLQKEIEPSIPEAAIAAIWIEQEINSEIEEEIMEKWYELIMKHTDMPDEIWFANNPKEKRRLYDFRHALPVKVDEMISEMKYPKISLDTCVNNEKYREYINIYNKLLTESGVYHVKWGHIGDSHLHTNLFPKNDNEKEIAEKVYSDIIDLTLEYNGTISAEHGIGKIKKEYLKRMFGQDKIDYFKSIKNAFDPKGILNQGNIFD